MDIVTSFLIAVAAGLFVNMIAPLLREAWPDSILPDVGRVEVRVGFRLMIELDEEA